MKGGWLCYSYLKSGTKSFLINSQYGPFSPPLHIGHITGGSVIWPVCNIPKLLHIGTKTGHNVIWVAFFSSFKVI